MTKAIIFDMDGTLYVSSDIKEKFAIAAYHTLAKTNQIPLDHAQQLIEKRRAELKAESGFSPPYTLTLKSFDVPIDIWHTENIAHFDPRDYLREDQKLKKTITKLKENYCLAIMTNNNRVQTDRILEGLNLVGSFNKIFTYNSFKILKPDRTFFKKVTAELGVKPEACLFIGDRYDVDLKPAHELGMQVLEVKGPEDIYDLEDRISGKEREK